MVNRGKRDLKPPLTEKAGAFGKITHYNVEEVQTMIKYTNQHLHENETFFPVVFLLNLQRVFFSFLSD